MKCFILIALIFATLFTLSFAGEFAGFFKDNDHPGKCFFGGLVISPGEEGQLPGKCKRLICSRSDGFGKVQGCGVQDVKPPCKLGDHINANGIYPDCCKRKVICP